MVFAIGIFGNRFIGMLNTCLYSIYKNTNESDVLVLWQNIDSAAFAVIKEAYPRVTFMETNFDLVNKYQRRCSKMSFWETAAEELEKKGYKEACFIDVDTLILKDLNHFFNKKFDIAFSVKNEQFPFNAGVMLVNLNKSVVSFFKNWKDESLGNISDKERYAKAKSRNFPYGGPDQMAFHQMLSFRKDQVDYELDGVNFVAYDSKYFNETKSKEITDDTHLIHYKGGWQKVLLQGETFSKKRTLDDSLEMYLLYIKTAEAALKYINSKSDLMFTMKQIGIAKPSYLSDSYEINALDYRITHIITNVRVLTLSYWSAVLRRLKNPKPV